MLTDAVRDEIGRAAMCVAVTADARGRPTAVARDAWAALGPRDAPGPAVALGGRLSPGVLRDLAIDPWVIAGFLDAAGRRGWRVEGPGRVRALGELGYASASRALVAAGFEPPRRILVVRLARLDRLDLEADAAILPHGAEKGLALLADRRPRP